MKTFDLSPIDWKAIIGKIRKEKCILILGPGAYFSKSGALLHQLLLDEIDVPNNSRILKYYEDDNFFLFNKGGGRAFTCERIEEFYSNQLPDDSINKLVQIPFHVILSVTPDKLLPIAFEEQGFSFQFDHYKKMHEPSAIEMPSKELPLIYNLFGCVEEEESLILTHNDLYDYFKSIFARKSLPGKLKNALQRKEINTFLFLGIPFDKWYMQLILRELEIHKMHDQFIRYAANTTLSQEVKTFASEQFTIQFIDKNIKDFIDALFIHCQDLGFLREKGKGSKKEQLQELISEGKVGLAIEQFNKLMKGTELEAEAIGLSGRFRRLKRKKHSGVLDTREIPVYENQIAEDLLELIYEANNL